MVEISVGGRYDVHVGHSVLRRLPSLCGEAHKVAVVHSESLVIPTKLVTATLKNSDAQVLPLAIPDGEFAKTPTVVAELWQALAAADFTRNDMIVGVGGGATTDTAGFVAASYLRGVPWVAIPTTVLGCVDAAVGGKTGIDLPEGKNLVGAFHEPRAVLADLELLQGLPAREVRSGLAEVIKTGFIADPKILELILEDPQESVQLASDRFAELMVRAVKVKADVVADDLTERTSTGAALGREQLNYGHTMGHAIEAHEHFQMRHGEAIAVGMVYAAELAAQTLGLDTATVVLHRSTLEAVGLPTNYCAATYADLRALISRDKKTRGTTPRFVLLAGPQRPRIVSPSEDALSAAYQRISG